MLDLTSDLKPGEGIFAPPGLDAFRNILTPESKKPLDTFDDSLMGGLGAVAVSPNRKTLTILASP